MAVDNRREPFGWRPVGPHRLLRLRLFNGKQGFLHRHSFRVHRDYSICVEAGFKSRGWRIVMRVSVTAESPLDNDCRSDQETKNNWHQDWRYQPLSQIEWLAGGHTNRPSCGGS